MEEGQPRGALVPLGALVTDNQTPSRNGRLRERRKRGRQEAPGQPVLVADGSPASAGVDGGGGTGQQDLVEETRGRPRQRQTTQNRYQFDAVGKAG